MFSSSFEIAVLESTYIHFFAVIFQIFTCSTWAKLGPAPIVAPRTSVGDALGPGVAAVRTVPILTIQNARRTAAVDRPIVHRTRLDFGALLQAWLRTVSHHISSCNECIILQESYIITSILQGSYYKHIIILQAASTSLAQNFYKFP